MTQMMVLMASQLQSQKLKQQRRRQQLTLLMILVMKPAPEPKAKAKTFWLKHSSTAKFITTAVMKAIGIISSGKVKATLTSTSQSGLRKPHLLYPSFAVTRMARMISRTKEARQET